MKNDLNNRPIGIFDSGLGGLTVLKELIRILSSENIIYFGDTARVPYGTKSKTAVKNFSRQITKFLIRHNVKLILVACNTASALALNDIKKIAKKIPVVGVIKSGVCAAVSKTVNKRIGVIGTSATVRSDSYKNAIRKLNGRIKVFQQPCPLFVPLVEEGWTDTGITRNIAEVYLRPLKKAGCDVIILGCTHYPMIKKIIRQVVGKNIVLIDSAREVSLSVKKILSEKGLSRKAHSRGSLRFYVSDAPDKFSVLSKIFLGKVMSVAKKVDIERY
ncbi:MAG TPA: glutamate racemase [Elusimicrobia bacterium]|nr:glutamate racemase [Elusimicrobiota bacterium]